MPAEPARVPARELQHVIGAVGRVTRLVAAAEFEGREALHQFGAERHRRLGLADHRAAALAPPQPDAVDVIAVAARYAVAVRGAVAADSFPRDADAARGDAVRAVLAAVGEPLEEDRDSGGVWRDDA
jgi:hypothetical protein